MSVNRDKIEWRRAIGGRVQHALKDSYEAACGYWPKRRSDAYQSGWDCAMPRRSVSEKINPACHKCVAIVDFSAWSER